MAFEPTPDQKQALQTIFDWYRNPTHPYLTMGGYAGTGKTSLLSALRHILFKLNPKVNVAFCAYTGKASRVLETTLTLHKARKEHDSVSTIHSLIYAPIMGDNGQVSGWKRKGQLKADYIIVDEASMVDRSLWEDVLSFGLPVLAVGDHGQLPPIQRGFNLMARPDIRLETIHRQAQDNPIINISMMARTDGMIPVGKYGNGIEKLDRYDSATGSDVESLLMSGRNDLLVLAGFNTSRIQLNKQMRSYYGFESPDPQCGDKVICLKNNWEKGIYNGMTGRIKKIQDLGFKMQDDLYEAEIDLEDGQSQFLGTIMKEQFNHPVSLASEIKHKLPGDLFDFGYALTVHKAQGSQSPRVLLFEERSKHMNDDDWRRWLYTGVTRAEEYLTIVGN